MEKIKKHVNKIKENRVLSSLLLIMVVSIGFITYRYFQLESEFEAKKIEFAETKNDLEGKISFLESEKGFLSEALYSEQSKNEAFEDQINDIADTVGVLEKLKNTDPELLQKYSKVFFLNEHYIPSSITEIDSDYVISRKDQWIHKEVWDFLENLIKDAKRDKVDLKIVSAYRTFDEQAGVKDGYVVTYGEGTANQFSAEQGYSEHQLGTTVDFTTPDLGEDFSNFDQTEAFEWLEKNAYKHGFVLSYPQNNDYYQFEPWHWRFVGEDLARKLDRDNDYFYDLDQREIDKYLVNIFD